MKVILKKHTTAVQRPIRDVVMALIVFVVMFLIYAIPSTVMSSIWLLDAVKHISSPIWLRNGFPLLGMVIALLGLFYWSKYLGVWQQSNGRVTAKQWAWLLLILVLVQFWVGWLGSFKEGMTANDQTIQVLFGYFPVWLMVIFVVLVAPVCEEILFRGVLIGRVFKRCLWLGVIVSSILFAAMHTPEDMISWSMYGSLGLFFSLVYWKTRSLWACVILHLINNLIASIEMLH